VKIAIGTLGVLLGIICVAFVICVLMSDEPND